MKFRAHRSEVHDNTQPKVLTGCTQSCDVRKMGAGRDFPPRTARLKPGGNRYTQGTGSQQAPTKAAVTCSPSVASMHGRKGIYLGERKTGIHSRKHGIRGVDHGVWNSPVVFPLVRRAPVLGASANGQAHPERCLMQTAGLPLLRRSAGCIREQTDSITNVAQYSVLVGVELRGSRRIVWQYHCD